MEIQAWGEICLAHLGKQVSYEDNELTGNSRYLFQISLQPTASGKKTIVQETMFLDKENFQSLKISFKIQILLREAE